MELVKVYCDRKNCVHNLFGICKTHKIKLHIQRTEYNCNNILYCEEYEKVQKKTVE